MRFAVALLFAAATLTAIGCTERPSSPLSLTQSQRKPGRLRFFDLINIDVRHVPLLIALDDLAAQGYTIETTHMASGALIVDALGRGHADIGLLNNQTMWTGVAKGAPVRTIARFTAPTTVLAARTDIRSCRDLEGQRVAVPATHGFSSALLNMYFEQNCPGVSPQFLVIVESAGRAAALLAGEVDAETIPREELLKLQLEAPGRFHAVMSYAREFPTVFIDGLHVRRQWAEQNPKGVKDFLRALLRAQRRVAADPPLLYAESVRRLSLDPATARVVGEAHVRMGIWDANGGLTSRNVQDTIELLTKLAALPPGLKVEDVAELSYLHAVLEEIGRQ